MLIAKIVEVLTSDLGKKVESVSVTNTRIYVHMYVAITQLNVLICNVDFLNNFRIYINDL